MENQDFKQRSGGILAGLFLLAVGAVILLRQIGIPFPSWLFHWPVILILIGLFIGLRHGFRGPGWIVLIVLGSIALADSINPEHSLRKFTAPAIIIAIGLVMIFRPRRNWNKDRYYRYRDWQNRGLIEEPGAYPQTPKGTSQQEAFSKEDYIDSVAIFGNVRKVVVSKDFRGGDMVSIFGGNMIDLSQADINGRIVMEVTQIMGGTKLVLPSHWDVKSEMVAFFGGIEDKRQLPAGASNPGKLLILKGTSIFGGIEIRNY